MENKMKFRETLSKRQVIVGLIMVLTQCTKLFGIVPENYVLLCEVLCICIFFRYTC